LISFVPLNETYSVAQFAARAHAEIDQLLGRGRRPIVVGGTGLYLRAALTDLELKPPPDPGLREELERELVELGLKALHSQLPAETSDAVHPNDRRRIVRALELERMGESPYPSSDQLWSEELRHPTALFGVIMDRDALTTRISARLDEMIAGGMIDDVEHALEQGASATARKAIGFGEIEALIQGRIERDEAVERIKRRHLQYVKRQLTWMRKLANVELVDRTTLTAGETASILLERLSGRASAVRA
jgi:tRNA dimethylallyltransferase